MSRLNFYLKLHKKYYLVLIIFFTFSIEGCSPYLNKHFFVEKSLAIIGGTPALEGDLLRPYVAGILVRKPYGEKFSWFQSCTGVFVQENWIATAAHCIKGMNKGEILINFSLETIDNAGQLVEGRRIEEVEIRHIMDVVEPENIFVHEKFQSRKDQEYDLALIHVMRSPNNVNSYPSILWGADFESLSISAENPLGKTKLYGYGLVNEKPKKYSQRLMKTEVPSRVDGKFIITFQKKGKGACVGDSGGPSFVEWKGQTYLTGITIGSQKGYFNCGGEGIYLNLSLFKDFFELFLNSKL